MYRSYFRTSFWSLMVQASKYLIQSSPYNFTHRGIYLRQPHEAKQPSSFTATVTPVVHPDAPNFDRLAVEDRVVLEPDVDWVTCPSSLLLHHSGRGFEVRPEGVGEAVGADRGL